MTTRRITVKSARQTLGITGHYSNAQMLRVWKRDISEARRKGWTEREIELNNVKAWIVKRMKRRRVNHCLKCRQPIDHRSELCRMHANQRINHNQLTNTPHAHTP